MIICGDTVLPNEYAGVNFYKDRSDFWTKPKIVNLESSVNINYFKKITNGIALQSDKTIVEFSKDLNVKCVTLANNHFFDFEIDVASQKKYLADHDVFSIGAGRCLSEAVVPYYYGDEDALFVAFGWNVIRCKYATKNSAGVNPYEYKWVETVLRDLRKTYPVSKIVAVFHWNYEFELYPQPADREFAHHLIDVGVDAIIGHHAHIIQGFEIYKDCPIFYGLGNCYFPNGEYGGFNLSFPAKANKGLSVSLFDGDLKVYVTELNGNKQLSVIEEGNPSSISMLMDVSGFQGMSHKEYIKYFSENRKKKKLLPIYRSYKDDLLNYCYDKYVIYRQVPVDLISKLRGGSR